MTGDIHPREAESLSLGEAADLWATEVEIHDLTYDNVLARLIQWFWEGRFCRSNSGTEDIHDPVHVARRLKRDAKIPDGWTPEEADPVDPPHYDPEFLRSAPLTFYSDTELVTLLKIPVSRDLLIEACHQTRTAIPLFWKDGKAAENRICIRKAEAEFVKIVKKGQRVPRQVALAQLRKKHSHLSQHAFDQIWSKHAPPSWKKGGRPQSHGFTKRPVKLIARDRFDLGALSKSSTEADTRPIKEREQLPLGLLAKHWAGAGASDEKADRLLSRLLDWLWSGYFVLEEDHPDGSPNITAPEHIARTLKSLGDPDFSKHPANAEIPNYDIETLKTVELWRFSTRQLDYLKSMPVTREQLLAVCRKTRTPFPKAWKQGIAALRLIEEQAAIEFFQRWAAEGRRPTRSQAFDELKRETPSLTSNRFNELWIEHAPRHWKKPGRPVES